MRPAALLGLLAVVAAAGALLVGHGVVLPELRAPSAILDANLARSVAAPLALRLAEVVLAASLVLAAIVGRWLDSRFASTASFVLVGAASLYRFALLPSLQAAWARVDLVAARPVDRLAEAQRLADQELVLVASMGLLLLGVLVAATWRAHSPRSAQPREHEPQRHPGAQPQEPEATPQSAEAVVQLCLDRVG